MAAEPKKGHTSHPKTQSIWRSGAEMSSWIAGKINRRDGKAIIEVGGNDLPAGISNGYCLVRVRQPRNVLNHRRYWATLREVVEATERWDDVDLLHKWLKLRLGYFRQVKVSKETTVFEWKSTDFASMDESQFSTFFDAALLQIAVETGIDQFELKRISED